jgi:hypothetical protein
MHTPLEHLSNLRAPTQQYGNTCSHHIIKDVLKKASSSKDDSGHVLGVNAAQTTSKLERGAFPADMQD